VAAIEGKPIGITDEKWKEMDDNAIANLYLTLTDSVLSSVAEKKTTKEISMLSPGYMRSSHFPTKYS